MLRFPSPSPALLGLLSLTVSLPALANPSLIPPQTPGLAKPLAGMPHPTAFQAQGPHCPPPLTPKQYLAMHCSAGIGKTYSLTDWKAPVSAVVPRAEAALRKAGFTVQVFRSLPTKMKSPVATKGAVPMPTHPAAVLLVSWPQWQSAAAVDWESMALEPVALDFVQVQGMTWSIFGKRSALAVHSPAFAQAMLFDAKLEAALRSLPGSLYAHSAVKQVKK